MEHALWKGKKINASDIANDYLLEKEIRLASSNKKLLCPDTGCTSPVLKYCHGEVKGAYFAHVNNASCDYANYDRTNNQTLRQVKNELYNYFSSKGYNVSSEIKLLPHHYTHLLLELDSRSIAVEITNRNISVKKAENLVNEYSKITAELTWIVIDDPEKYVSENNTYYIKRYLLNESKNKELIVINKDCNRVAQYKVDPYDYIHESNNFTSGNYPGTFVKRSDLDYLVINEQYELSIAGFQEDYYSWLKAKSNAFNKMINNPKALETAIDRLNENRPKNKSQNKQQGENELFERILNELREANSNLKK